MAELVYAYASEAYPVKVGSSNLPVPTRQRKPGILIINFKTMDLSNKKCVPCEVGGEPMKREEIAIYERDVPAWKVAEDGKKISRTFKFKDFREALDFVDKVGEIAESEGHHPDILLGYGKAGVELSTHAVGGLSANDFILAAKIDKLNRN